MEKISKRLHADIIKRWHAALAVLFSFSLILFAACSQSGGIEGPGGPTGQLSMENRNTPGGNDIQGGAANPDHQSGKGTLSPGGSPAGGSSDGSNTVPGDSTQTGAQPVGTSSSGSAGGQTGEGSQGGRTGLDGINRPGASGTGSVRRNISDVKVKGLYMTGWTAGLPARLDYFIELIDRTELNTIVLDIKDDDGYVGYDSEIPLVREIGAVMNKYDVKETIRKIKNHNIHLVGRLVCFKDPILSSKKPELAVQSNSGGLWRDDHGLTWLNPYNKNSWPYILKIAREAVELGFDEIQFDYVRFPNDGDKADMNFGSEAETKPKYQVINEFLAYARKELGEPMGIKISADVFGIICESPEDVNDIGQYLEKIGKDIEYISPMVYPSHYALGQVVNGQPFPIPDLEPYKVVYNSLIKARNRIAAEEDYKADVRPYLQSFTASYLGPGYYREYGAEEVRQQIQAVYDAGYDEWILWSAGNEYPEGAFKAEP